MAPAPGAGRRRIGKASTPEGAAFGMTMGLTPFRRNRSGASGMERVMASLGRFFRLALGTTLATWALLLLVALAAPAQAQQPNSVNPTASSVKEQQLLQELNRIQGRVSIPDARSGVLEQPQGRDWRNFRDVTLRWVGGIAILGMIAALIIFYFTRGLVKIEG